MLAVKTLNQFYGGSHTLWDVDLNVTPGSNVPDGPQWHGQDDASKCIMGLLQATNGGITFEGTDLMKQTAEERAGNWLRTTGPRNLFAADGGGKSARRDSAFERMERARFRRGFSRLFPVLKQMLHRRGGDLSGGQQQQLAIGRALVLEPKLLILDEPTEGIQPNIVHEIGDIILRLNKEEGLTVLLVEQKLPFARRVASEFCILDKGRKVAGGAISELSDQSSAPTSAFELRGQSGNPSPEGRGWRTSAG
jgi:urea transport system ATP-binding protein